VANIERSKASDIFDGMTAGILPEHVAETIGSFIDTENLHLSAIREIVTKLENLNDLRMQSLHDLVTGTTSAR
jgi:hypothetical protein